MAGKFINTNYNSTMKSVIDTMKNTLKNPYYKWSDKSPAPVEYYNIDTKKTTLDDGTQNMYDNYGPEGPAVYNRIDNMIIYGLDQFQLQMSNEDFGVETAALEGEAIILPNTIIPYVSDRFVIEYLKNKIVFKVTQVDDDTIENDANAYKIQFRISTETYDDLQMHVGGNYTMIMNNVGTALNPIIQSDSVDLIKEIENVTTELKSYYKDIFYSSRVQSPIFKYLEAYFYDSYMIEFIRNNKILEGGDSYIYITHQLVTDKLFPIKYTKTFFHCLETKDTAHIDNYSPNAVGVYIDDPNSIFEYRLEEYYSVTYDTTYRTQDIIPLLPCFQQDLFEYIKTGRLFTGKYSFYNIIIKYMHNGDINSADIKALNDLDIEDNITLFYAIPCLIFCLEQIIMQLMSKTL